MEGFGSIGRQLEWLSFVYTDFVYTDGGFTHCFALVYADSFVTEWETSEPRDNDDAPVWSAVDWGD